MALAIQHKRKKRLKAIQHYEIKIIYIDNLFFLLFLLSALSVTPKDHKFFIVDWIRLEALSKASTLLVKIVFFHIARRFAAAATNNHDFQLRKCRFANNKAKKRVLLGFYLLGNCWGDEK